MLDDGADGAVEIEIFVDRRHQRGDAVCQLTENAVFVLRQILLAQAVFGDDQIFQKRAVKEKEFRLSLARPPGRIVKIERQEAHLRVERPAFGIGIVVVDVGVILRALLMEGRARPQPVDQPPEQRGLAGADRTADRNILHPARLLSAQNTVLFYIIHALEASRKTAEKHKAPPAGARAAGG